MWFVEGIVKNVKFKYSSGYAGKIIFDMKCRSSKAHVFLSVIKTVFPMFDMIAARFAEVQMHFKGC